MKRVFLLLATMSILFCLAAPPVVARGGGHYGGHSGGRSSGPHLSPGHPKTYCTTCARDRKGRIQRNSSEREKFLHSQGLTHTPPGDQVDHIKPLAKGGEDKASNMQLIQKDSAKEKNELK